MFWTVLLAMMTWSFLDALCKEIYYSIKRKETLNRLLKLDIPELHEEVQKIVNGSKDKES